MINIKGIISNRGYIDIIDYPEKKEILIDICIGDIKKCKEIVYKYLDATTSIYKTEEKHFKMFKARMERFLKIDKTKGEEFTHSYEYDERQETGVYSDTVWDEYILRELDLRIKKHYK